MDAISCSDQGITISSTAVPGEGSVKPASKAVSIPELVPAATSLERQSIGEDLQALDGIDPDDVHFEEEEDDDDVL